MLTVVKMEYLLEQGPQNVSARLYHRSIMYVLLRSILFLQ